MRTLERLSYTHHGGELWKPPLGDAPAWADSPTETAGGADAARLSMADRLWLVLQQVEDKCDVRLEALEPTHHVWELARVAAAACREDLPARPRNAREVREFIGVSTAIAEIYASTDTAVEFAPRRAAGVEQAQQRTQAVRYVMYTQNMGILAMIEAIKDGIASAYLAA